MPLRWLARGAAAPDGVYAKHLTDLVLVDVLRVERSAIPLHHPGMLLVARIERGLEELHEPMGAADVLRRTAPGTGHECRVFHLFVAVADFFNDDVVPPVVPEVVHIEEALHAALDERLQTDRRGLVRLTLGEDVLIRRHPVYPIPDHKLVQMIILPAERRLNDVVQRLQRRRERHIDAPPDLRLKIPELDADARHRLDHAHRAGRGRPHGASLRRTPFIVLPAFASLRDSPAFT